MNIYVLKPVKNIHIKKYPSEIAFSPVRVFDSGNHFRSGKNRSYEKKSKLYNSKIKFFKSNAPFTENSTGKLLIPL